MKQSLRGQAARVMQEFARDTQHCSWQLLCQLDALCMELLRLAGTPCSLALDFVQAGSEANTDGLTRPCGRDLVQITRLSCLLPCRGHMLGHTQSTLR